MNGADLKDLTAFMMVAEELSFTRAAARLGVTQSALSQTVRGLEARLELRLFTRTTRSVALTDAGERLLGRIGPAMGEIDAGLAELGALRDKPTGTIRLTADEYAIHSVLQPALARFLPDHPGIRVELTTDYGLTDIVSGHYDAGVRRGGLVAKDMIATRIGPDVPMTVVGAPSYFARHPRPAHPSDLVAHACLNLRLPTHGEFFAWSFRRAGKTYRVKVDGPLVHSSVTSIREAARLGLGLAYLPEDYVRDDVAAGRLDTVLDDWRQTFEGYHLYYADRRHQSAAFALFVAALRYRTR
jgi:DNA-binding transcriptional LysR family regulator